MLRRASLAVLARLTAEPLPGGCAGVLLRSLCKPYHPPAPQFSTLTHFQPGVTCRATQAAFLQSRLQLVRQLTKGAAAADAAIQEAVEDTLRPKILRIFAFIMICGAGLNVLPMVAAQSVGNCLALLDAQQPFMVKAGCSRLQLLMRLDAARNKAVEEGAVRKLLKVIQRPEVETGVAEYILSTLEILTGCDKGLQSLVDEGGAAALASYLAGLQRTPATEDAVFRAQKLLAAVQNGNGI